MRRQIDYLYPMLSHPLQNTAGENGIEIRSTGHYLDFIKKDPDRIVRLAIQHWAYINDIITSFDYYFTAVEPLDWHGYALVDYSLPRHHQVVGFDLMPVKFTSLAEPMVTSLQYQDFANLQTGDTVFDLGAYSGLTSILFKEKVGRAGHVIAIDADTRNIETIRENLALYRKLTDQEISLVHGAMWNHCEGLDFSSDGNMGASATEIIGMERGSRALVRSYTLSKLADDFGVSRVDFVKCDIEGAEALIFDDDSFFRRFRPRIIIETHLVNGVLTNRQCIDALRRHGYRCEPIEQLGVTLPLLACAP